MDEKERSRALGATLTQIEKQFGKGSVIRLGAQPVAVVPSISTGSISVDHALGVGGFPRGRISEIFGPESSGKTTVALQVVAEAQKLGGMAAYIDVEHALESEREERHGRGDDEHAEHDHAENGEPGDDVLEETPEFLQDTPDHDRLWFEQKPPRDFDFDG